MKKKASPPGCLEEGLLFGGEVYFLNSTGNPENKLKYICMRIIANRKDTETNDRFGFHLKEACRGRHVDIAVAFFTDYETVKELIEKGSEINLIVRLNRGTKPYALRQILGKENVQIRYYTDTKFHPKLYIVRHSCAFVGSSNLTESAMYRNNEVNIVFDYEEDEDAYIELERIFDDYWKKAAVLDNNKLKQFEELEKSNPSQLDYYKDFEKTLGFVSFENTSTDKTENKKDSYINKFKREYQNYLSGYAKLTKMYSKTAERKWPEEEVPLRIEIDRFLWWLRRYKCRGPEGWVNNERYSDEKIESLVLTNKAEYLEFDNEYLESIAHNYEIVADGFSSPQKIKELNEDELFSILTNVHAFHETFHYQEGGMVKLKEVFFEKNNLEKIKRTITYLAFGSKPYEERIYDCIFNKEYKLARFGEPCVKELYGYVNNDNIPICNGRTIKSMEWLGFGKL